MHFLRTRTFILLWYWFIIYLIRRFPCIVGTNKNLETYGRVVSTRNNHNHKYVYCVAWSISITSFMYKQWILKIHQSSKDNLLSFTFQRGTLPLMLWWIKLSKERNKVIDRNTNRTQPRNWSKRRRVRCFPRHTQHIHMTVRRPPLWRARPRRPRGWDHSRHTTSACGVYRAAR